MMSVLLYFDHLCFVKIIFYDQIEYIKDTSIGKRFATTSPFDLYVYIRGKKHPIGISMPSSLQKRDKLKK